MEFTGFAMIVYNLFKDRGSEGRDRVGKFLRGSLKDVRFFEDGEDIIQTIERLLQQLRREV